MICLWVSLSPSASSDCLGQLREESRKIIEMKMTVSRSRNGVSNEPKEDVDMSRDDTD